MFVVGCQKISGHKWSVGERDAEERFVGYWGNDVLTAVRTRTLPAETKPLSFCALPAHGTGCVVVQMPRWMCSDDEILIGSKSRAAGNR